MQLHRSWAQPPRPVAVCPADFACSLCRRRCGRRPGSATTPRTCPSPSTPSTAATTRAPTPRPPTTSAKCARLRLPAAAAPERAYWTSCHHAPQRHSADSWQARQRLVFPPARPPARPCRVVCGAVEGLLKKVLPPPAPHHPKHHPRQRARTPLRACRSPATLQDARQPLTPLSRRALTSPLRGPSPALLYPPLRLRRAWLPATWTSWSRAAPSTAPHRPWRRWW
jgi:hypothetical protein